MIIWRKAPDYLNPKNALFRREGTPPEQVFAEGFRPGGDEFGLDHHVMLGQVGRSAFVSFSLGVENPLLQRPDERAATVVRDSRSWVKVEYLYQVFHPNGLHVDATWHERGLPPLPAEQRGQLLIPGGVPGALVKDAIPLLLAYRLDEYGYLYLHSKTFKDTIPNEAFAPDEVEWVGSTGAQK